MSCAESVASLLANVRFTSYFAKVLPSALDCVERAFVGGEVVRMDCENEGVTIDSIDARADVALSSDFFLLTPGDVELTFSGCSSHVTAFHERWL